METMTDEQMRLRIGVAGFFGVLITAFLAGLLIYGCEPKCTAEHPDSEKCPKKTANISERTLTVWNLGEPEEWFSAQLSAFSQRYDGKVHFKYETFADEEAYERRLIDALAAHEGPDVFAMHYSWLAKHKNKLTPVPETKLTAKRYREIFYPALGEALIVKEDEKGTIKERIYGISLHLDALALFYNKRAFADLPAPYSVSPREKWADLQKQVTMLTRRGTNPADLVYTGIAMGRGSNIALAPDILALLFLQHRAAPVDAKQTEATLLTKPVQQAFALYSGFADQENQHYAWNSAMATETGKDLTAFLTGKTAMVFGYADLIGQLKTLRENLSGTQQQTDLIALSDIGSVPVPQLVGSEEQQTWGEQRTLARFYPLAVSKDSKYKETAWDLLIFLAQKEQATNYAALSQKPSSRRDVSAKQAENVTKNAHLALIASQLHLARPLAMGDKLSFEAIMRQTADRIADREMTLDAGLRLAQKQMQCVVDSLQGKTVAGKCTELKADAKDSGDKKRR